LLKIAKLIFLIYNPKPLNMEFLNQIKSILSYSIYKSSNINITIGLVTALIVAFVLTNLILKLIRLVVTRNLPAEDKNKFISIFQFIQYLVYIFVIMFTLNATGVNISVFLTASAALFIGLGFALQQLFQDLISGVLIIIDQSLHVGDVIEINGKVCKVEKISLRSTKAVTRNQRVMVIPNHMFLTEVLFNWTQNSAIVREDLTIGVA
jgi:small-conductance mechanosensitive channel